MYTVHDDYGLQRAVNVMGATFLAKPASRMGLGEAIIGASRKFAERNIDKSKRILIAEDNESVREILQYQFSMLGVNVVFVENGVEALNAMATEEFSILITDLHMPELDGYGLVRSIRDSEKRVSNDDEPFPIIVLTADVQMSQRQAYLAEGFDECLLKPVSIGELRQLLIRWGLIDQGEALAAMEARVSEYREDDARAMKKEIKPPAVDLVVMEEQMGAVDKDTVEMLAMFPELTEPLIVEIRECYEAKDCAALENAAHSLKGSSRYASCMVLGDIASDLQDNAHELEMCGDLVLAIEDEFIRVQVEIQELSKKF
jgi:CheY-like chemotaxis protein/HPt (histidine-containing phosphotransfer) domain-containing protein